MLKHGDGRSNGSAADDDGSAAHGNSSSRSPLLHDGNIITKSQHDHTATLQPLPPPPSRSSSTASQYSGHSRCSTTTLFDAATSTTPYSSSVGIPSNSSHSATAMFSSLSSNLMRSQHERDPMVIYEVMEILGKGSMGSVSRVRKRDEAVGGSARPQFVKKHYTAPFPAPVPAQQLSRGGCSDDIARLLQNCWMLRGGCCPFSPFTIINNNSKHVFVATGNGGSIDTTDENSNTSDLTCSNRKRVNHQLVPSMSSWEPPSRGSSTHNKGNACTGLRACIGVNGESCCNINSVPPRRATSKTAARQDSNHHLQPSSMIRNHKGKTMSSSTSSSSSSSFYALKSIHLNRCSSPEYQLELKNEVEILKSLDHPNIVRAIETFDYRHRLFIVLELCSGGDLYTREPYTEAAAKRICKSLFSAVAYLHSKDIIHRDLKFENVMFVTEKSDQIKIIDFGLSQKFASSQEHLHDQVGTVYTMAPELLAGDYNNKADVWSLGVMSYMLLSSSMPFFGKTRERVIRKILKGRYQFSSRRWNSISSDAVRFVSGCLTMKPEVRPSAEEALRLHWLSSSDKPSDAPPELDQMDRVQACMLAFAHYSTLKKLALLVVAYKSTSDEVGFLRGMFEKYDVHEHGEISLSDFKEALSTWYDYSDFELEDIFHGIDVDGTGTIQYSEFLAATIEAHGFIDEERLAEAFDRLDSNDDGYITVENLRDFLGNDVPATLLEEIIDEADLQGTRRISYEEFVQLWNDEDDEILSQARSQVKSRHLAPQCSMISSVSSSVSLSELNEGDEDDVDRFAPERGLSLAAAVSAFKKQQQEAEKKAAKQGAPLAAIVKEDADCGAAENKTPQQKSTATSSACFNQRKQMSIAKSMRRTLVQQQQQIDNDENDGGVNDANK